MPSTPHARSTPARAAAPRPDRSRPTRSGSWLSPVIPGRRAAASPESKFQRPVFVDSGPPPPGDPGMTSPQAYSAVSGSSTASAELSVMQAMWKILDLRIHAVALADAGEPRPAVERLGVGAALPQIDAASPAILGINELLAYQPRHAAEAGRDVAEMLGAGVQINRWRQLVLHDRRDHRLFSSRIIE